jgi:hypothetical protein
MSFLRDPKRLIATIIAGVTGLIVLIGTINTFPIVELFARTLINWAALLASLALLIGLLNVVINHVGRIVRRREDWGYSLVLLAAMIFVIVSGTLYGVFYDPVANNFAVVVLPQAVDPPVRDLLTYVYQPLAASFLALLAFFSLSAALRAVQRRTADALVIVGVAMVVLLFNALPQAEGLPLLGEAFRWVNDYVVLAGARGLLLGAAIGALIAGVRVLLGFDQPYLDR